MKLIDLINTLQKINNTYDCDDSKVVQIYLNYDENSKIDSGHHGVVVGFRQKPGQENTPSIYEIIR